MSQNDRPVDPLIARRDAPVLDLTPPGTTPTVGRRPHAERRRDRPARQDEFDAGRDDFASGFDDQFDPTFDDQFDDDVDPGFDGRFGEIDGGDGSSTGTTPDGTDGFDLFDDGPEPVAAWDRSPAGPRPVPPQLKVLAAIVATVAVIWAIVALRGPSEDGTEAPANTVVISATLALGTVQQNAGTTTVDATLTSAAGVDEVLSNHVWLVRDGVDFPEAIAFIGCLAVDDQLDKPFTGTYEVVTPVNDATACGVGGFQLAPGDSATVRVTALGLAPGAYRVLVAAWTSEPFTVA